MGEENGPAIWTDEFSPGVITKYANTTTIRPGYKDGSWASTQDWCQYARFTDNELFAEVIYHIKDASADGSGGCGRFNSSSFEILGNDSFSNVSATCGSAKPRSGCLGGASGECKW